MPVTIVSHEACENLAAEYSSALHKTLDKLREMTRDRDEWMQQHENLLAMYRAQTQELAVLRAVARTDEA
jgi:hypothetical protein